jgi:ABC-type lipoprotein export system ATPase subunit
VEVLLFAEIANIAASGPENTLPSADTYILAMLSFFPLYYFNRFLLYRIPRKAGEVLSERLLEARIMSFAYNREETEGYFYSLVVDEVRRFSQSVVTPLLLVVSRLGLFVIYGVAGYIFFGASIFWALLLGIPVIFVLFVQKAWNSHVDDQVAISQKKRSDLLSKYLQDELHLKSYRPLSDFRVLVANWNRTFYGNHEIGSRTVDLQRLIFDAILFGFVGIWLLGFLPTIGEQGIVFPLIIILRAGPQFLIVLNNITLIGISLNSWDEIRKNIHISKWGQFASVQIDQPKTDLQSFDEIHVKLETGERFACGIGINLILGESGCGKTTLLEDLATNQRRVVRIAEPYVNKAKVSNTNISSYSLFLSPNPEIVGNRIEQNCLDASVDQQDFVYWLKRFAINDDNSIISSVENGGYGFETMSVGQKQRVALARALASSKPILLIDESVSGLDNANKNKVLSALINSKKICILATHDQDIVSEYNIAYQFK